MNRLFEFCSIEFFQRLADRKISTRLLLMPPLALATGLTYVAAILVQYWPWEE